MLTGLPTTSPSTVQVPERSTLNAAAVVAAARHRASTNGFMTNSPSRRQDDSVYLHHLSSYDGGVRRSGRRGRRTPRPYIRGEERRARILAAAADLFAEHGFAGTTTRRIAEAAGTTETVLFRHFPAKHSLYAA